MTPAPKNEPKKEKKAAIDVIAPYETAKEAIKPMSLAVAKPLNPGGYAVDLVAVNGSRRQIVEALSAREVVSFLNGIAAAAKFIKEAKP